MGTKSMNKMKIGTRIIVSYLLILIIVFLGMTLSFRVFSRVYLVREAREQLGTEGRLIADMLKGMSLEETGLVELLAKRRELRIAGRFLDSKLIVLNKDRKPVYTNLNDQDHIQIAKLIRREDVALRDLAGFVVERTAIYNNQGSIKGYVVLLTELKDIESLNTVLKNAQLLSFFIAAIFAFLIGIYFQSRLTKPLRLLMDNISRVSFNEEKKMIRIKTGDEFEELADSFNMMLERLNKYEYNHKRFLQNSSHELKTPLMSIQGYAEAIKDGVVKGQEVDESLAVIIAESQRLKKVVDEIIYLTKIEEGKETYCFVHCDIQSIIKDAIRAVKPLADERGVELLMTDEQSCMGTFDEGKLKRAFINVIGNALRYAHKSVKINEQIQGGQFRIEIIDDGAGFKAGEEKIVFERFYKGEKGSTGLGLSITKAIIEAHGGRISAENSSDGGAAVTMVLPWRKNFL